MSWSHLGKNDMRLKLKEIDSPWKVSEVPAINGDHPRYGEYILSLKQPALGIEEPGIFEDLSMKTELMVLVCPDQNSLGTFRPFVHTSFVWDKPPSDPSEPCQSYEKYILQELPSKDTIPSTLPFDVFPGLANGIQSQILKTYSKGTLHVQTHFPDEQHYEAGSINYTLQVFESRYDKRDILTALSKFNSQVALQTFAVTLKSGFDIPPEFSVLRNEWERKEWPRPPIEDIDYIKVE
ncbi:hypothetical protein M231_06883 [Tremella mesenterica]|uniref:Uncharacterized protein n=1 Tax=Tremella mesenterica TaxID=5217 RepID=A0A4Q1BET6_TREME|nr:uncharacterized protein TREMEDRAFT_65630 [Tremella mesenterica DSM 1558]EIW66352.1 hypothetical protein TREMEDRAFT_65630 [Tremella mesenterica DSM 1558]RXK35835.1 hypothetical protein M231_06883 [Tremella mesenterica]